MIKRPRLNTQNFVPLEEGKGSAKHECNSKVCFADCHQEQPAWLKHFFAVHGVVRRAFYDTEKQKVVYQVYLPTNCQTIYLYETDLLENYADSQSTCPWGTIESAITDGLMIKVNKEMEPEQLLAEVAQALELDAVNYLQHKRRIHVMLKTTRTVVRVSYEQQPEYRVFAKKVSYKEALEALLI